LWLIAAAAAICLAFGLFFSRMLGPDPIPIRYTDLVALAEPGQAVDVQIDGERFVVRCSDGKVVAGIAGDSEARRDLIRKFAAAGAALEFHPREDSPHTRSISAAAPIALLVCAGIGAFLYTRKSRRGSPFMGRVETSGMLPVRFTDVAGMAEAKDALGETVDFLRSPERFSKLGGRPPRGVLLTGEPGTGKTLLARAVATEAGVPFLSAAGSSFQEMFVGVGASRVRSLFAEARRLAPCIVFIDEIDATGRARSRAADSASADHDQTLNQLLIEMDGFDATSGVVVMASTNRPDVLDPALLRPGRFDRQIYVPLPDLVDRRAILEVHARPLTLHESVDLTQLARSTPGFSGADLANVLNEAAILAAREDAPAVDQPHIERARDRVLMGAERKSVLDAAERYATAVHEAGHVAVGLAAPHADPIHKVSILPRGRALGVTQSLPERDRVMIYREHLEDQVCMLMGGRAAEMVLLGTMTAGAADDIQRAVTLSRRMVAELGMSDLGPIHVSDAHPSRSQALLDLVEEAARSLVEAQLERARDIIEKRHGEIGELVRRLLEQDTLDAEAIMDCFPNDRRRPAG
jgi:cell division protease FtsH